MKETGYKITVVLLAIATLIQAFQIGQLTKMNEIQQEAMIEINDDLNEFKYEERFGNGADTYQMSEQAGNGRVENPAL